MPAQVPEQTPAHLRKDVIYLALEEYFSSIDDGEQCPKDYLDVLYYHGLLNQQDDWK